MFAHSNENPPFLGSRTRSGPDVKARRISAGGPSSTNGIIDALLRIVIGGRQLKPMTRIAQSVVYLTLAEATGAMPGQVSLSTIWRYVLKGVRGVKLSTIVRGGRRLTTPAMIDAFVAATTAAANGTPAPSAKNQASAAQRRAKSICDQAGI